MRRARLAAVVGALVWALFAGVGTAAAAPGDPIAAVKLPLGAPGRSVAFDGHLLYYTNPGEPMIHSADPRTGAPGPDILTAVPLGVIAYDATRDMFWGVAESAMERTVFLVDKLGNEVPQLQIQLEQMDTVGEACKVGCDALITGIAYDSNPDSLWIAPDGTHRIYHFSTDGTLLGWYDIDLPGEAISDQCGIDFANGLAVATHAASASGGLTSIMYDMAGPCDTHTWFKYAGDDDDTPQKLAYYPTYSGTAMEDDECDDVTFKVNVVWIRDAVDGFARAYEAPNCTMGGGTKILDKSRMTGGGGLPVIFPLGAGDAHHGFMIHCDVTVQPDRLQVTWGNGYIFHMTSVDRSVCPTSLTSQSGASFDTIDGTGHGRLTRPDGTRVTGRVDFNFKDNGEPGATDTGDLKIYDDKDQLVMEAAGMLLLGPLAGEGNYQSHQGH